MITGLRRVEIKDIAEADWREDYEMGQVREITIEEAKEWYDFTNEEAKIYVDAYLACLP